MRQLIVAAAGLQGARAAVQGEQFNTLPFLGDNAVLGIARVLHLFPAARLPSLLAQAFPFELTVDKSEAEGVHALLAKLGMSLDGAAREPYHLASTQQLRSGVALVRLACGVGAPAMLHVPAGPLVTRLESGGADDRPYVHTDAHDALIVAALQNHAAGRDMCIIGAKGLGKQTLVRRITSLLFAHPVDTIYLYKDMTARDLLQRRVTLDNGDTAWCVS